MTRLILLVAFYLLSAPVNASFELQDPARDMTEELQAEAEAEQLLQDDVADPFSEPSLQDIGNTSCSEYLSYAQDRSWRYWSSNYWVQGFIEGATLLQESALGSSRPEPNVVAHGIGNFCNKHPSNNLTEASQSFVEEFSRQK